MKYLCISAANIRVARHRSASVHACQLIQELLQEQQPGAQVEIVPLIDCEMKPCKMCGKCSKKQRCIRDRAFNRVFEKMIAADGIFFVVPHYAPLPSKLMILFEKMEEIAFLGWTADSAYRFPLAQKPAGVVAHGGQLPSADVLSYYHRALVEPVAAALGSLGLRVAGGGEGWPDGIAFGIRSIEKRPGSIFVDIEHDWDDVRQRLAPLVSNLAAAMQ